MKNININFGSIVKSLKSHVSIVLWLFLGLVILLEATVVKGAIDMVIRVRNTAPNVQTSTARVNVQQYDAVEKSLEQNSAFEPSVTTNDTPFGQAPRKQN